MTVTTVVDDGVERKVDGLRVTRYDIPAGCVRGLLSGVQSADAALASREGQQGAGGQGGAGPAARDDRREARMSGAQCRCNGHDACWGFRPFESSDGPEISRQLQEPRCEPIPFLRSPKNSR